MVYPIFVYPISNNGYELLIGYTKIYQECGFFPWEKPRKMIYELS